MARRTRNVLLGAARSRIASLAACGLALAALAITGPAAADASCATSSPSSGAYSVTVCITTPTAGAAVSGQAPVTATVAVTGTNPGVMEVVFLLNGSKLLWAFQAPYTWTLDSTRWTDGTYSLSAYAIMRGAFTTSAATESVSFSNGITTPPVNSAAFQPAAGTTPPSGQPFVLAAAGDGASGQAAENSVVSQISTWNPNLFLYLGDVYEDGRPMEFNNWYGQPGTKGTYGQFYGITDPAIGNHEYVGQDISGYEWYWNNVPHYYSFNANGWHFVSLDDVSSYVGTTVTNKNYVAETNWLKQDLASNTDPCTIAFYHEPYFNVGTEPSPANAAGLWQILAQNHVTLVLNGHDHDYQRWTPMDANGNPVLGGTTEIVDGNGGHGLQAQQKSDSRLAASDFKDFGALRLALGTQGAAFQFVTTGGVTADSGSVPCAGAGQDTTPPTAPQNLTATALSQTQVQLSWSESADDTGVTDYDIYRNGTLIASEAPPAGYLDQSVQRNMTYSYQVVAKDAAGNASPPSNLAVATTLNAPVFSDGFETGDMSMWTTSTGMAVQNQVVADGTFAAEAPAAGSPAFAAKKLPQTYSSLYYETKFNVQNQASTAFLLRLQTAKKAAICGVYLTATGKLALRNDVTGVSTTSTTAVTRGSWHTVQVYVSVNGALSTVSVWLDGLPVPALTGLQSLGSTPVGYLQLGENSAGRTFDIDYDDVAADTLPLS